MSRKVIIVNRPDGTKKIIVGDANNKAIASNNNLVKVREGTDRRPKPVTPKISISKEKNGYKYGGKIKLKIC